MTTHPVGDLDNAKMLKEMRRMADEMKEIKRGQKVRDDHCKKEMRKMQEQIDKTNAEIRSLATPKVQYIKLGGDTIFYTSLDQLIPELEKQCKGDAKKLEELKAWEKKVRKLGWIRLGLSAAGSVGAGAGLGAGGIVAYKLFKGAALKTALKAVGTLAGLQTIAVVAGGALLIFGIGYAAVRVYYWYSADNKVPEVPEKNVHQDVLSFASSLIEGNLEENLNSLVGA